MIDSINRSVTGLNSIANGTRVNSFDPSEPVSAPSSETDLLVNNPSVVAPAKPEKTSVLTGTSPAVTLTVSKESQEKAVQDLATAKLVRKANAVKELYDAEKVAHFKQLANNPQALNTYLSQLDTTAIANTVLESPEGSVLFN